MGEVQMLFPMEPKEFWQKLKAIVEQVVIEHNNAVPIMNAIDKNGQRPLLKVNEVCAIFKITKPTLYEWIKQGRLGSLKIQTRRYFKWEDVERLIESSRPKSPGHTQ
jgi:excisionase family DNA binding protein